MCTERFVRSSHLTLELIPVQEELFQELFASHSEATGSTSIVVADDVFVLYDLSLARYPCELP